MQNLNFAKGNLPNEPILLLSFIGTGNIGKAFCKIIGFGCYVLAFDIIANKELEILGVQFVPSIDLFKKSDIISLHSPLNEHT